MRLVQSGEPVDDVTEQQRKIQQGMTKPSIFP